MDDRALVAAMVSGDPRGLEGAYRRYAPQLHAYCVSLLGDGEQAADAVHDTFVLAGERVAQLRDPDLLRPWLYAIARNECLRHRRGRARLTALDTAEDPAADTIDLAAAVHADQVRELVHAAAAGLTGGDREVIELALRHGSIGADAAAKVAAQLGVSNNHAHARLSRARTRLEQAIGVLLVARAGRSACPTLAALLDGWNGRLDPLLRKRLSRHIDRCAECGDRRGQLVHPGALLAAFTAGPMLGAAGTWWFSEPGAAPDGPGQAPVDALADAPTHPPGDAPPAASRRRATRRTVAGAAAALLVVAAIVTALTRVTDPATLAGQQQPRAAAPSVAPSATPDQTSALTPGDEPSLRPGGDGSDVASPPTKPSDDDDGTTNGDPDRSRSAVTFGIEVLRFAPRCAESGKSYVFTVRVRGTQPLARATVFWRASPTVAPDDLGLGRVDATTREGTSGTMRLPTIEWWVEATALNGDRASTTVRTATNPCRR